MRENFQSLTDKILSEEGGLVNNPHDPGGWTNMGVTLGTLIDAGIDINHDGKINSVDVKSLTRDDASAVFKHLYWQRVNGDALPSGVDFAVYDFAINSGVTKAGIVLQQVLNTFGGALATDGKIGPKTFALISITDERELIARYCDARLAFLESLSTWRYFGAGWKARVEYVRSTALTMVAAPITPEKKKGFWQMGNLLNWTVAQSVIRWGLQGAGAALVANGFATSDQANSIEGGALAVISILWGIFAGMQSHNAKAVKTAVLNGAPTDVVNRIAIKGASAAK